MKNLYILVVLFLFVFSAQTLKAQDLIVTLEGDSLNCRISRIMPDKVYFTYKHQNEIRSVFLPKTHIVFSKKNFYTETLVPAADLVVKEDFCRWRLEVDGGVLYRLGETPSDVTSSMRDYYKDYKSGVGLNLGVQYFTSENLGFGFLYNHFNSKASVSMYNDWDADGVYTNDFISENVSIDYYGPVSYTRFYDKFKKNALVTGFGIGYLDYIDKSAFGSNYFRLLGGNVGIYFSIGYDMKLTKSTELGIKLGLVGGTLTKMTYASDNYTETVILDKDSRESLSHIDFTVGLRFNK